VQGLTSPSNSTYASLRGQQKEWGFWLPLAPLHPELWTNASTKKSPFELILDTFSLRLSTPPPHAPPTSKCTPSPPPPFQANIPDINDRLNGIQEAREEAQPRFFEASPETRIEQGNGDSGLRNREIKSGWGSRPTITRPTTAKKLSPSNTEPFEESPRLAHVATGNQHP